MKAHHPLGLGSKYAFVHVEFAGSPRVVQGSSGVSESPPAVTRLALRLTCISKLCDYEHVPCDGPASHPGCSPRLGPLRRGIGSRLPLSNLSG